MKTIGLLGGMSWQSTVHYYQIINEQVAARLGGLHSAKIVLSSIEFDEMEKLQKSGRWQEAGEMLANEALGLRKAGADFLVICTNTMHKVAGLIETISGLPVLHIADATAAAIKAAGKTKVGLLGTRYTMEEDFYRTRLIEKHGLEVFIPDIKDREMVNRVIYDELCLGLVRPESKQEYLRVMQKLTQAGAQGIILGCTEIEMLVSPADYNLPLYPTTYLHAVAAVDRALA